MGQIVTDVGSNVAAHRGLSAGPQEWSRAASPTATRTPSTQTPRFGSDVRLTVTTPGGRRLTERGGYFYLFGTAVA
ncbi:hypothetical protein MyChFU_32280 [Mycobacterium intracellulare subsp. chimaera]